MPRRLSSKARYQVPRKVTKLTQPKAVVGDTIGDPFKDTSGPSLNILIKLMSIVSVVIAGLL